MVVHDEIANRGNKEVVYGQNQMKIYMQSKIIELILMEIAKF